LTPEQAQRFAAQECVMRVEAQRSLAKCIAQLSPDTVPARHHRLIIEKLEAVARGEITRLMIMAPPGSAKSTYASILFPAWFLGCNPGMSMIGASHAGELAERFGRRVRNLVGSAEFRRIFGFGLSGDNAAAGRWETAKGGEYYAVGVDASVTGRRADCVVGSTIVETMRGLCRIDALENAPQPCYVLSHENGTHTTPTFRRVVAVARRRTSTLWRIRTVAGRMVEATGDHRIFTARGWTSAQTLVEGDVLLCTMWGKQIDSRCRGSKENTDVLQSGMRGVLADKAFLPAMWDADAIAPETGRHETVLFGGVLENTLSDQRRASAISPEDMRHMWQGDMATGCDDMQPQMWRHSAFSADDGRRESRIPTWDGREAGIDEGVVESETDSLGSRSICLCRLQDDRDTGRSSHQYDARRSSNRESRHALSVLSQTFACSGESDTEEDIVSGIERICRDCFVYDIEVEGTHCFFANGVLVHNCGIIDDPVKGRAEADSASIRQRVWDWYKADFWPRLKPGGRIVIILTRWHEDDLAGRLLAEQEVGGEQWEVLSLPAEAGEDDPLGRAPGELLWPEWFTPAMFAEAKRDTRNWSALYQQQPVPDTGDYFKAEWIRWYDNQPDIRTLRTYGASDYAVTSAGGDYTVHGVIGVDPSDNIYLLDWWRGQTDSEAWVEAFLDLMEEWSPLMWGEEQGQIIRSLGPFIVKRQMERRIYGYRRQYVSANDKQTRAQGIRARLSMGKVYFPKRATWATDLVSEMLRFPAGRHDDQVDVLSLFGRMLGSLMHGDELPERVEPIRGLTEMTFGELDAWQRKRDGARGARPQRIG
jgi:predicted phage terminase large subunit-like protein